jgi:hypothetical protein
MNITILILLFLTYSVALDTHIYKFDSHSHFRLGWDKPKTIPASFEWHRERNFDTFAFTEHTSWLTDPRPFDEVFIPYDQLDLEHKMMPVIPGIEWSSRSLHATIYFRPSTYDTVRMRIKNEFYNEFFDVGTCRDLDAYKQIANVTHQLGGLIALAHYSLTVLNNAMLGDDGCKVYTLEEVYDYCDFDLLEVANTIFDLKAYDFAKTYKIAMLAGTDIHNFNDKYKRQEPVVFTYVDAQNFTAEAIFNALVVGNTSVKFDHSAIFNTLHNIFYAGIAALGLLVAGVMYKCKDWIIIIVEKCKKCKIPEKCKKSRTPKIIEGVDMCETKIEKQK